MDKYLYGVVRENGKRCFGLAGIGGPRVHTIACRGVAALVSDSHPLKPDSIPREKLLSLIAAHQAVIEKVAGPGVLPVKFGTTVAGEREVRILLERGRERLLEALERVEAKMELVVAAVWSDLNSQLRKVVEEEKLRPSKESLAGLSKDRIMEVKLEMGRRMQAALRSHSETLKEEMLASLKNGTAGLRLREVMDDSMIMNAAFWLERGRQAAFESRLRELDARFRGEILFRQVGPLPPYSFMTVEVEKIDPAGLERACTLFGLDREAPRSEVQEKYRELTRKHHPDRLPGDPEASRRFEEITAAYRTLQRYGRQGGELGLVLPDPPGNGENRPSIPRTDDTGERRVASVGGGRPSVTARKCRFRGLGGGR